MNGNALTQHVRLALDKLKAISFRANVGMGWTSTSKPLRVTKPTTVTLMPGDVVLRQARPFSTGLPTGFSDTFGFTESRMPFFLEIKAGKDRLRPEQRQFLEAMRQRGVIAAEVRSVEDAISAIS